ncbi:MAG: pilus assembly protein PilP [Desulfuromusa sp.]|jgi:Tfp pilus assembly protein PilP|nr:pilus assembly protein PilP [Desulfuromusa sp.]
MKLKSLKAFGLLFLSISFVLSGIVVDVFAQQDPVQTEEAQTLAAGLNPSESDDFAYSPRGRRDPFKPLIQEKQKIAKVVKGRPDKIKGPLEKFELSQYRLIALIVVKGVPRAMVKAPDGKSYTVKVGEYIGMNDGIVKNIETKVVAIDKNGLRVEESPDRMVIEEVGIDSYTGKEIKENRYIAM